MIIIVTFFILQIIIVERFQAVSSESVMSDRICIASGGKSQTRISGQDLLSCAESPSDDGCGGGSPLTAFRHWVDTGVVTGGPYGSKLVCYSILCSIRDFYF